MHLDLYLGDAYIVPTCENRSVQKTFRSFQRTVSFSLSVSQLDPIYADISMESQLVRDSSQIPLLLHRLSVSDSHF